MKNMFNADSRGLHADGRKYLICVNLRYLPAGRQGSA